MFKIEAFKKFVRGDQEEKERLKDENNDFQFLDNKRVEEKQDEKREEVISLKKKLKFIDEHPEEPISFIESENLRTIDYSNGQYFVYGKGGKKEEISLGEIMVASLWGKNLKLSGSVPRKIKKRFLLLESKRAILKKWNEQLEEGMKALPQTTYADGVNSILEKDQKDISELPAGFAAEKMINSFLTRLSFDLPDLPFEFIESDVYDDVYQKIDFRIKIKKEYVRGLNLELCQDKERDCDDISEIGVQYTMNRDKANYKQKQIESAKKHLEDVDDIVLVTLPISGISRAIAEWKEKRKKTTLTGPEEFLNPEIKKKLFFAIFSALPKKLNLKAKNYLESLMKII